MTFHNGQPFDADDVIYTFNFVVDPANKVFNMTNVGWMKSTEKIDQYKVRDRDQPEIGSQ